MSSTSGRLCCWCAHPFEAGDVPSVTYQSDIETDLVWHPLCLTKALTDAVDVRRARRLKAERRQPTRLA